MKRHQPKQTKFILLFLLVFSSLACSLSNIISRNSKLASEIEEDLTASGQVVLRDIVSTSDIIKVAIDVSAGESQFAQFACWLSVFEIVLQHAPEVALVRIDSYFLDEPYLAVTAQSENIEAVVNEEIDLITFYDRLLIEEQSSPSLILTGELMDLGWIVTDVQISDDLVEIKGFSPDAQNHEEIVVDWIDAMALAAEHAPDAQQISLHLLLIDTPNMIITVDMADLTAYLIGELDEVNFVANWMVSD